MKTQRRTHVDFIVGMVRLVKSPKQGDSMIPAMPPVIERIENH